jgi:hypothetical protein
LCITFSCFVQLEQFKLFSNLHFKLYKSSCTFKGNKIIFKCFLNGLKINYELFNWESFVKTTAPTLGGHNFITSSPFLLISSATNAPRKGLCQFLDTINNGAFLKKWWRNRTLNAQIMACLPYF